MYTLELTLKKDTDILTLYQDLKWNDYLKKTEDELLAIMVGSYYVTYLYLGDRLVGTGRIISDGHLTALICGVGIHPDYQSQGYGHIIIDHLLAYGTSKGLMLELTCTESLESYYQQFNFKKFTIGMKYQ